MKNLLPLLGGAMLAVAGVMQPCAANAQTIYGLTNTNQLISFQASSPGVINTTSGISGLMAGHELVGMDFRPATGELFALANNPSVGMGQLYVVNLTNSVATPIGAALNIDLSGRVGFDFNPVVDRIRVTTTNNKNYRLNPNNGALAATDGDLAFNAADVNAGQDPNISAAGYTNNVIASTATTLFVYDDVLNILASQIPPNNGVLNTIGQTGISVNPANRMVSMDIHFQASSNQNMAFVVANPGINSNLYRINASTGASTNLGQIGSGLQVKAMSVFIDRTDPGMIGRLAYGLTSTGNLVSFYTGASTFIRTAVPITGLLAGDAIVSLDFRPANDMLYGLSYDAATMQARIYTINLTTAVATPVTATGITGIDLSGKIAIDFNPVVDRLRVVTSNGKNYRFNQLTGTLASTDGDLAFAAMDVNAGNMPRIGAVAYTNSTNPTPAGTTLYDFDEVLNVLTTQSPPNNGVLNTIGATGLGATLADNTDMDIFFESGTGVNTGYISKSRSGNMGTNLYQINLSSGSTSNQTMIGMGISVLDIALPTNQATCLSGNYTLNPALAASNTNFVSFAAMNSALTSFGICGPVSVAVAPGAYTGAIMLGEITGSSTTNVLTLNGNGATINFCSSSAAFNVDIIELNGTDNIVIDGFNLNATCTYGTGVRLMNGTDNVTISNNMINVMVPGPNSTSVHNKGIYLTDGGMVTITGNTITGGRRGIQSANQTGVLTLDGNTFTESYEYGIGLINVSNAVVTDNLVQMRNGYTPSLGFNALSANNLTLERNYFINTGRAGIQIQNSMDGSLVNNRVGFFQSSDKAYGMYLYNVSGLAIYHNSLMVDKAALGTGLRIGNASSLDVRNNIFEYSASGTGYALYGRPSFFSQLAQNDYYNASGGPIAFVGQNIADLAAMAMLGYNTTGSFEVNPGFTPGTSFLTGMRTTELALADVAAAQLLVPVDFEMETRSAGSISLGADEFGGLVRLMAINKVDVDVYPNPFTSVLNVELSDAQSGAVEVILSDLMGRQIAIQNYGLEKGMNSINFPVEESLAQGVYLLQVTQGGATSTFRVVKQ